MAPLNGILPSSTFLGIPVEIRTIIYALTLRADCSLQNHGGSVYCAKAHQCPRSFRGCTKILSVCKQIYEEAVELLHSLIQEPKLALDGRFKHVLRHPLEFGKPGFFNISKRTCKCYVPKPFDELQIIRMRKFAVDVFLPTVTKGNAASDLARIAGNVREMAVVLGKSKTMKVLRVRIHRADTDNYVLEWELDHEKAMQDAILPLIKSAVKAGFELIIQVGRIPQSNHAREPLVDWIVTMAGTADVKATKAEPDYCNDYSQDLQDSTSWIGDSEETQANASTLDTAGNVEPLYHGMLEEDFPNPVASAACYELVPQCRFKHCNAYFREKSELTEHLQRFPRHKQPFFRKTFNTIHPYAVNGAWDRKCWTCAKQFTAVRTLDEHLDQCGHRRYGIVPKYQEDNEWWNRKWKANKEKRGWL